MKPLRPTQVRRILWLCTVLACLLVWARYSGPLQTSRTTQTHEGALHDAEPAQDAPAPETVATKPATANAPGENRNEGLRPGASPDKALQTAPEFLRFQEWIGKYSNLPPARQPAMLEEGISLAKARKPLMESLIRTDPQAALSHALRWDQWAALPTAVKAEVERPFSDLVDYTVFPVCPGPQGAQPRPLSDRPTAPVEVLFSSGERASAFVYGQKNMLSSKRGIAAQGIAFNGLAALREGLLQPLQPEEVAHAEKTFPSGQADAAASLVTGKPIAGERVTALAGGRRFSFASNEELRGFDAALAKLDAMPGPRPGSRALFALPYGATGAIPGPFNLAAAQEQAAAAAAGWTSGEKKVFLIRVKLPDLSDAPPSREAATTVVNGTVSTSLREFSYNKTWVTATVSANVYTLPQSSTTYVGTVPAVPASSGFTSNMTQLLEDARATFRTQKSGADSSVDIGAGAVNAVGADLGDYDIVGMIFPDIGCYAAGIPIAGLASVGGGDLWIQGTNDPKVYVHEFGHVYGLGHSNFWQTSTAGETSPVGQGSEEEYGDVYDVMGKGGLPHGHFHPQAKQKLDWLGAAQWTDASATGSGLYRIYRHDSALTTGSLRGVRLTKNIAGGEAEYYWIGYRPGYTENPRLTGGAYLLWQRPASVNAGEKCCLLDTTPLTSGVKTDAALDIGRTYSDRTARVHLTPVRRGGEADNQYLDVQIHVGTLSSGANLTLTLAGTSALAARTTATFTAEAAGPAGESLAYFWDAGDGTISGGTGASAASFSHAWLTEGSYTLNATVTDMKGGTRTSSIVVNVTDPARHFSPSTSLTSGDINALAASPNLLVAVGGQNPANPTSRGAVIRTSPDGVTWTERQISESSLNLRLKSVVWDGAQFVAAGADFNQGTGIFHGVIYTSPNGFQWTRQFADTAADTGLNAVCVAGSVLVAVGDSGTVLRRSAGAAVWERIVGIPMVSAGSMSCRGVAYGGGVVALTARTLPLQTGGGVVCTSDDLGLTWSNRSSGAALGEGEDLEKIAFLNGNFIASGWFSKLKTSTDGARTFTSTRTNIEEAFVLAHTPGLYFAGGVSRVQSGGATTSQPVWLYSTDGRTWADAPPQTGVGKQTAGLFFNNRLVTVGTAGAIWRSNPLGTTPSTGPGTLSIIAQSNLQARSPVTFAAVVSNPEKSQLTYHWDAGDGTTANNQSVFTHTWAAGGTYSVKLTVTDGKGGSVAGTKTLTISDPAQNLSKRSTGTTEYLNAITCSNDRAVAAGDKGTVLTSEDGVTWTKRTLPDFAGNIYFAGAAWDGTRFVLVGQDYNSTTSAWIGVIYSSTDGSTWARTYKATNANTHLRSVTCAGGTLLAGGDRGQLLRSTNGSTWTASTLSLPETLSVTGLASGGGVFVAVAHTLVPGGTGSGDGRVYTSTDGNQWVERTAGAGFTQGRDFNSVAYLNDRFVASGWNSGIRVSTNLGLSFQSTRPTAELTPALAYGGGVYLAAGVDQDNGDAKVRVQSSDGSLWTQSPAPSDHKEDKAAVFFKNTFLLAGGSGQILQSAPVGATGGTLEILLHPASLTLDQGGTATFSVLAVGSGSLSYQWQKDAVALPGETGATLVIQSANTFQSGSYTVHVADSATGATLASNAAVLSVVPTATEPGSLVTSDPPQAVTLIKGTDATLAVSLSPAGAAIQTSYVLYSGTGATASPTAVAGIVPASGAVLLPLKTLTTPGAYFARFTRTFSTGPATTDDTTPFTISFANWDPAAGNYQALLAAGSGAALGDGATYRGLLNLTLTRSGIASGRLSYTEATTLQGGTSNQRVYAPVVRSFAGRLTPKPGQPAILQMSPALRPVPVANRELLSLELDLSQAVPALSARVTDTVSLAGGSLLSSADGVTAGTLLLGPGLASLAGRYTVAADLGGVSATRDQRACVQLTALPTGLVVWNSRLNGYSGAGSGYLNLSDPDRPVVPFYEGRQSLTPSLHNSTSLLGVLHFQLQTGSLWSAAFGSDLLPEALEKQASYVVRQSVSNVLTPVFSGSLFATGGNFSGRKLVSFSHKNGARWSGTSFRALPSFFPTTQTLTLSAEDPLSSAGLSFRWQATVSSSGAVRTTPQTASDGTTASPPVSLVLTRPSGSWSGAFTVGGVRRTLSGISINPDAVNSGTRAAQGFVESGTAPNLRTGTWTLAK